MEIHWSGLLVLLASIGCLVGYSLGAMVIGVPIVSLIDWYERHYVPGEIGKDPDWQLIFLFGWAIGCIILGLILFAILYPR